MADSPGELLLLVPTTSYRLDDFRAAARRLGVPLVVGSDRCHRVEDFFGEERDLLSLDYRRPARAAEQIAEAARRRSIRGIVPASNPTAVIAALAAERLGLPHNPPEAARRAANKHAMRIALRDAGVPVPAFRAFRLDEDPEAAAASLEAAREAAPRRPPDPGGRRKFRRRRVPVRPQAARSSPRAAASSGPTIPPASSRPGGGSRSSFATPRRSGARGRRTARARSSSRAFVAGAEVAVEGLLRGGALEVLAVFDKPDPLDGPYFEETIYVTPSRHPAPVLARIEAVDRRRRAALGLVEGPVHAELRLSADGPVVLEVAARSIGGLCSRTLRFGAGLSLEEVLVAHAMGLPLDALRREARAAGVMMLPIPSARGPARRARGRGGARGARASRTS